MERQVIDDGPSGGRAARPSAIGVGRSRVVRLESSALRRRPCPPLFSQLLRQRWSSSSLGHLGRCGGSGEKYAQNTVGLVDCLASLVHRHPVLSIQDGQGTDDQSGWKPCLRGSEGEATLSATTRRSMSLLSPTRGMGRPRHSMPS